MKYFYRPLTYWRVVQPFGANQACIDNATNSKYMACDGLNPPPGYRSVYSMMKGHNGLDLVAALNTPVYASQEGVVIEKETEPERGLGIGIKHGPFEGKYYKTRYWHLITMEVDIGDYVSCGQLIGYADNTGYSTGDHLHFEMKECDTQGNTLNHDNGYFGAIDPAPLLSDIPAVKVNLIRLAIESIRASIQAYIDGLGKIKTSA